MASPQTHGAISLAIFGIFILLSALGLANKITFWEYVSAIIWGIFIDFDHFLNWKYVKDLLKRIKRGGGMPGEQIEQFVSWLHVFPGLVLVWVWGIAFHWFVPSFRIWFPFLFWAIHMTVDFLQKDPTGKFPHFSLLYPFDKKKYMPKHGYPVKPPWEFILDSFVLLLVALVLLGLLILK